MNTVFENGMFWKLIFFHAEIAQYKEIVLSKSDKTKVKEERERVKKLVEGYVRYWTLNSMTKNVWSVIFSAFLIFQKQPF